MYSPGGRGHPQRPGMQKLPLNLPILQAFWRELWQIVGIVNLRSSYQSISQNERRKTWKRHDMGKKSSNVSTATTGSLLSRGVITDSTRDLCRGISACQDPFCKLLEPSRRFSCCSMLQINEKFYFTYMASEGLLTVWICCCESTKQKINEILRWRVHKCDKSAPVASLGLKSLGKESKD